MLLRHLDLFSGIGGFALAARMVGGYETVGFCEIEPYCQAVLRKHWPGVPIYDDVRSIQRIECDVVTGGFPCQPFSEAGKRLGREDDRHLWPAYRRVIEASRPAWVVGENVPGLVWMEIDNVLADLGSLGYSCQTFNIPACAVGARHRRERIWIVAHSDANGGRQQELTKLNGDAASHTPDGDSRGAHVDRLRDALANTGHTQRRPDVAQGGNSRPQRLRSERGEADYLAGIRGEAVADAIGAGQPHVQRGATGTECSGSGATDGAGWWDSEPDVGRVADGVSRRVDRLRGLGNAIVPQVAAIFLQAIREAA